MTRVDAAGRGTRRVRSRHVALGAAAAATALAVMIHPASGASPLPAVPVSVDTPMTSPAGYMAAGPRSNGTGVLPDGRIVTPVGHEVPVGLQPINALLTRDGRRLVVVDAGFDDAPTQPISAGTHRFLWTVDTASMTATPFEDDAATYGIAEARDGTLYVAEGNGATHTDAIGIFAPAQTASGAPTYTRTGTIALNPSHPVDQPWGIALSPDGTRLYVAAFSTDTLITVDVVHHSVVGRTQAGQYPYSVVVSADGSHVYVSNWGLYNQEADTTLNDVPGRPNSPIDPPPATAGGYNTDSQSSVWTYSVAPGGLPSVQARTRIGLDVNGDDVVGGALPSALALSPDQRTLAVTASNDDLLELLDVSTTEPSTALPSLGDGSLTTQMHPSRRVDMRAITGGPTGAQPDALAWSPDGSLLFVAEGGRNTVAVVNPSRVAAGTPPDGNRAAIAGRIPTGWYPTAVVPTPDGSRLYIADNEGLGSGPNGHVVGAEYDPNTLKGMVQAVDMRSTCDSLRSLSRLSDRDNGLVAAPTGAGTALGDGAVVPTHFGAPPSNAIKHVFIIIKENRTFDQELGDYSVTPTERDQSLVMYGQHVTPNLHALTAQFANGDNFYANSEVSIDGHFAVDTGQINEFLQKLTSSNYAGKFPYGEWDTMPENLPQGGFIWNNAARGHVSARIYGEGTYVVGVAPEELGKGVTSTPAGQVSPALFAGGVQYDSRYPSQVDLTAPVVNPISQNDPTGQAHGLLRTVVPYDDEYRAQVFAQDMQAFTAASGNGAVDSVLPQLNVMILFDDHGNGDFPGRHTPETETAENDHAMGEVVNTISTSPFWKDSAVFVTEDDTQGGQDHVDAHRTFALVASPWVQHGRMSHLHTSFSSITKTADLILGLPPTSLQELTASSLADDFIGAGGRPNLAPYTPRPNQVMTETNRSLAQARNPEEAAAARLAQRVPQGIDQGGDILPEVERLQRLGELEAGDPNVVAEPNVQQHTLPSGSPETAAEQVHQQQHQRGGGSLQGCIAAAHGGDRHAPAAPAPAAPLLGGVVLAGVSRLRLRPRA